jgi:hypothetical protein
MKAPAITVDRAIRVKPAHFRKRADMSFLLHSAKLVSLPHRPGSGSRVQGPAPAGRTALRITRRACAAMTFARTGPPPALDPDIGPRLRRVVNATVLEHHRPDASSASAHHARASAVPAWQLAGHLLRVGMDNCAGPGDADGIDSCAHVGEPAERARPAARSSWLAPLPLPLTQTNEYETGRGSGPGGPRGRVRPPTRHDLGTGPGTISGNHRANSSGHSQASSDRLSAAQSI